MPTAQARETACGSYDAHQAGFEYDWATESLAFLGTKGCSEAGF